MDIEVISSQTGLASDQPVNLSSDIFDKAFNMPLVHQVVVAEQNAIRSGTKAQKNRAAVRGGGAKPWRQKGTGRARAGTSRSPIWRSGGVAFAATTRSYEQKVNKKMYRAALSSLLSELIRSGSLKVCEDIEITEPKTKLLVNQLKTFQENEALLVVENISDNLFLASRNLYHVGVVESRHVNSYQLLQYKKVFITRSAMLNLQHRLSS